MTQPAGYYPPQQPVPGQAPYGAPAPGYAQQPPAPGYPPQGAYAPPAQGYPPQAGWGAPPPGYGAPGYAAPPAPGFPPQAAPPQPDLARGTLDDWLNQSGGSGAENITKIFAGKPFGAVTVSFLVARKILSTDMRQQTNAQNQAQFAFDGRTPLFVLIVPCQVIGSTDGSHVQLFPDGQASWWVKGQPKDQLAAAMAMAGAPEGFPEAGARIDLTLTGERASKKAGHNPSKQYKVVYTRPVDAPNQPQPALDATALQAPAQQSQQAYAPTPNEPPFAPQAAPVQYPQQPDGTFPATYAQPGMTTPGTATQLPPQQYIVPQGYAAPAQPPQAPQQYADPSQQAAQQWQQPQPPQQWQQAPQQVPQAQFAPPAGALAGLNDVQRGLMDELRANGAVPPPAHQVPAP